MGTVILGVVTALVLVGFVFLLDLERHVVHWLARLTEHTPASDTEATPPQP